jgi:hypothetical protein
MSRGHGQADQHPECCDRVMEDQIKKVMVQDPRHEGTHQRAM